MFCDLVGSTALSEQLDPEDLRAVIQAYRKACTNVIERYDGHVAQYLGDGVMVYFGWPMAHEDDAGRAVRAGLDIVTAVAALEAEASLAVRVGIATGLVVVGETGGDESADSKLAVGETPNVAARVQGLAEAGS
jgi:class 3 adenylate cyclase